MLFKITYSIPVENVKACQERFMTGEEKMDGLMVTGRWHEVGKSQGFMIAEADDMIAVGKFTNQWSDLCNMDVTPIMTDEQIGQVLMAQPYFLQKGSCSAMALNDCVYVLLYAR